MDINITLTNGANLYIGSDGQCRITPDTETDPILEDLKEENLYLTSTNEDLLNTNEELRKEVELLSKNCEAQKQAVRDSDSQISELRKSCSETKEMQKLFEENEQELNNKIATLTKENMALTNQLQSLKQGLNGQSKEKPLLIYGMEKDLFDDEIKDYILEAVAHEFRRASAEGTRKYDVLADILGVNKYGRIHEDMRTQFKALKSEDDLEKFGFVRESQNKHAKYSYYGDGRYTTSVAITPSDNRAFVNTLSDIAIQCM